MGLVDYSDSESESEVQANVPAKQSLKAAPNKPFQKFVDRSNPGKILVNLPTTSSSSATEAPQSSNEPPAKRARTTGGSRFSGFSSFLPPPKTTVAPAQSGSSGGKPAPRPGIHLKTGAEPAFSRAQADDEDYTEDGSTINTGSGGGLKLPPPKNHSSGSGAGPSVPDGQKPAEEVKLVGKPLMFKPLSVSRKPVKKKKTSTPNGASESTAPAPRMPTEPTQPALPAPEPAKKKVSLFSIGAETETPLAADPGNSTGVYEPLFSSAEETPPGPQPSYHDYDHDDDYSTHSYAQSTRPSQPAPSSSDPSAPSLSSIADDLNLTPQARRELFGRDGRYGASSSSSISGGGSAGPRVVNFDMAREYEHNEAVRQSGGAVAHNPVRSIRAGKHSLRQLVNAVQSNAGALEESFAAQKGKKNEAGARYGWR